MAEAPTVYTGRDGRKVRVYRCDVCGTLFEWGTQSRWFGPMEIEGDWHKVTIVCSRKCRVEIGRGRLTKAERSPSGVIANGTPEDSPS